MLINARILTHDMFVWFQFYVVVLLAFACPLSMLTNDGSTNPGYGLFQLLKATFSLIQHTFNASPNDTIDVVKYSLVSGYNDWIFDIFFTGFYVVVNVLMVSTFLILWPYIDKYCITIPGKVIFIHLADLNQYSWSLNILQNSFILTTMHQ